MKTLTLLLFTLFCVEAMSQHSSHGGGPTGGWPQTIQITPGSTISVPPSSYSTTVTCINSAPPKVRYYCSCDGITGRYQLNLRKFDFDRGLDTVVRVVDHIYYWSENECLTKLVTSPTCKIAFN